MKIYKLKIIQSRLADILIKMKRNHGRKMSYECRIYELLGDMSLS